MSGWDFRVGATKIATLTLAMTTQGYSGAGGVFVRIRF